MTRLHYYSYYCIIIPFIQCILANAKPKIIFASYKPQVVCTINETNPASFSGTDVMFIKDLFSEIGWNINDFELVCAKYQAIYDLLNEPDVLFAIGGILIQEEFLNTYKYSQPYCNTGASIIVKGKYSAWKFVKILDGWIILWWLLTSLFVIAPLTYLFENGHYSLADYMYYEVYNLKFERGAEKTTLSGMLITFAQITIAFMLILIFESFLMQSLSIQTAITSEDKVIGKRIATWSTYKPFVDMLNADYVQAEPDNPEDVNRIFHDFGLKIDGGLYDNWLLYITERMYPDLYLVKANIIQYSFGLMFPFNTPDDIIHQINMGIIKLSEEYSYDQRMISFIKSYYTLSSEEKMELEVSVYRLKDIYSLWIIFCAGMGFAIFIKVMTKLTICLKTRHRLIKYSTKQKIRQILAAKSIHHPHYHHHLLNNPPNNQEPQLLLTTNRTNPNELLDNQYKPISTRSVTNRYDNKTKITLEDEGLMIHTKQYNNEGEEEEEEREVEENPLRKIIDFMKNQKKKPLPKPSTSLHSLKINPIPDFNAKDYIQHKSNKNLVKNAIKRYHTTRVEKSKSTLASFKQRLQQQQQQYAMLYSKRSRTYHFYKHGFSTREKLNKLIMKMLLKKFNVHGDKFMINIVEMTLNKQVIILTRSNALMVLMKMNRNRKYQEDNRNNKEKNKNMNNKVESIIQS